MGESKIKARIGLVALLLLAAATCGGDDDDDDANVSADVGSAPPGGAPDPGSEAPEDGGAGNGGDATSAGASGEKVGVDVSPCVLLEPSEIQDQFPDAGAFAEGNDFDRFDQCFWQSETATELQLAVEPTEVRSMDERLEYAPSEPVPVEGLGDEAYYAGDGLWSVLYVVTAGTAVSLQATYIEGVEGAQEKLEALAQLALSRL